MTRLRKTFSLTAKVNEVEVAHEWNSFDIMNSEMKDFMSIDESINAGIYLTRRP